MKEPVVFKKVKDVMMGEDAQRFLALLPIVKSIDDALDKKSPDTWPYKDAALGDEPCPFLAAIITDDIRRQIQEKAKEYKVDEKDLWQNCNLLAIELAKIRDISKEVRRAETLVPGNLLARKALVAEHEQLSILATNFLVANFKKTAGILRNAKTNDIDLLRALAIDDRIVTVNKRLPHLESRLVAFSKMQQAVDDANDFIVDLRSEAEQGRISPNRHILALKEAGIDPKEYFVQLKHGNEAVFEKGGALPGKALGAHLKVIQDDLREHLPEIKKYAAVMAVRGIAYRANSFPTTGDDLKQHATTVKLQGDMSWGQRVNESARAAIGLIGL